MSKTIRVYLLAVGLVVATGLLFAQSSVQATHPASASSAQAANVDKAPKGDQGKASVQAGAVNAPEEDEEENIQFKYSPIVKKVAKATGFSKESIYWIFLIINFAILAAGLVWLVRKALPNGFAPRTAEIRRGIEEARKVSAEASARLGEIESRLAKLDTEIAELRTAAEADFSAEEERIKAAAEQDAKNVVAAAEQEIAAAARTAQRELKSFVAGLAVDLAEKKIKVDDATDQALVRGFAAQLGKDGQ
jgi:F-type H+-transporting ATPase subunit b